MPEIKNRKKRRSFMQQMKKIKRRGEQSRGGQLPQEIYTYYFTVYEELKKADKDNRAILIKRVIQELVEEKKVKLLASNQLGSRILDEILGETPTKFLLPVIEDFSEDLRPIFGNQFLSHVLQTLLIIAFRNIQEGAMEKMEDFEEEPVPLGKKFKTEFITFLLKVSRFTFNNLEDFIQDIYASYIVRTVMEICSGVEISPFEKGSRKLQGSHSLKENPSQVLEVPESLTSVWREILERIKQIPRFEELILCDCGSATIQTALFIFDSQKDSESIVSLASHIIEFGFMKLQNERADVHEVHPLFDSHASCRLMEALVSVVPEKNQELIYGAFFREQMMELIDHEIGCHAVEKLFVSWKSKDSFTSMLKADKDCIERAFLRDRHKIIFCVFQSCRRLDTFQSKIVKKMIKIVECHKSEDMELKFAGPLLYMIKLSDYEEKKEVGGLPSFSIFGVYILQEMLHFSNTSEVVSSILEMSSTELLKIACDPRGSHVIEAFFSSPSVLESSKMDLYKKLRGNYVVMACSKHGSFCVEHIFNFLNMKHKTKLCKELVKNSDKLQASSSGNIVYLKFQLQHFNETEEKNWMKIHEKISSKKLFLKRMREENEELDKTAARAKQSSPSKRRKEEY